MFEQLPLPLQEKWKQSSFEKMTAIQEMCYPLIAQKQDVVAISSTGTGKTLAYALPLLARWEKNGALKGIVLAPSQELAQQIGQVFKEWSDLVVQVITGGANLKRQLENLKKKPDVIVATPGRLEEIARQSKKIKFHQVDTIVLDEADHLLQDEQIDLVRQLVKRVPGERQLLFFSATTTKRLEEVTKWFNTHPEYVQMSMSMEQVQHGYILVEERKRAAMLKRLAYVKGVQAIVFVNNIANLALLYEKMLFEQVPVVALHSEMRPMDRKKALEAIKKNDVAFLLTTDIAARGLDIANLPMVIHYDLPREEKVYTHRSGRTGRMGKTGLVISLVPSEKRLIELLGKKQLLKQYRVSHQRLEEI